MEVVIANIVYVLHKSSKVICGLSDALHVSSLEIRTYCIFLHSLIIRFLLMSEMILMPLLIYLDLINILTIQQWSFWLLYLIEAGLVCEIFSRCNCVLIRLMIIRQEMIV